MADRRLTRLLEALGADGLISADPGHIRMLTGHVADIETGPNVFGLPPIVVASGDGTAVLVCAADQAPADGSAETYAGFTIGPLDFSQSAVSALTRALERSHLHHGRVIVHTESLPMIFAPALPVGWNAADGRLAQLGAIKTETEIAAISRSLAICSAGQSAARSAATPGITELDVWEATRAAMEHAAAGRCPVLADLVAGARTGAAGGAPSNRIIVDGDLVLCDLVPRVDGIWGDSCATWSVGDPTAANVAMHATAQEALWAAIDALKPGAIPDDIDCLARTILSDAGFEYPHHTGHGLGFRWHEEPRIVPGALTPLEAGMVVALEPGAYRDGAGVRVEVVAEIVQDGCRVLSTHALDLYRDAVQPTGGSNG